MSTIAALFIIAFALLARRESPRASGLWRAGGGRVATVVFALFVILALSVTIGGFDVLLAVLAMLLVLPGPLRPQGQLQAPAFLESRIAVVLVGAASAAVVAFVWGSFEPVARVHDEGAYLLQGRLFASGRWTGLARPLPEFFEQMQLFVTPVLASKYPPGHSLFLVPGIWLGLPALVPILLNGVAGALLFVHARRLSGGWVGLIAWLLWASASGTLGYRASYLSQNTTTVLWLLALWALSEWLSSGSKRWLVVLAACLGLGAITRPMTMFALALPIGFVVLRRVGRARRWRELSIAALIGSLFLAVGVLWSIRTIGEWRTTPYREYSRIYFPYEWTGFGERPDPPIRPIPPGMDAFDRQYRRLHAEHTVQALPEILKGRVQRVLADHASGRREVLLPLALFGTLALCARGFFALLSAVLLFGAHLYMAHFFGATFYYLEAQPVVSYLAALGVCGGIASVVLVLRRRLASLDFVGPLLLWSLVTILTIDLVGGVAHARETRRRDAAGIREFDDQVKRLPGPRVIVFVRYAPDHEPHRNLVVNEPDLETAKAWIVHDRGDRNALLRARAPERKAYLYDESTRSLVRID